MATERVEEIYEDYIEALPAIDQLRLVALIARGLAAAVGRDLLPPRTLLELEGLGEET